MNEKQKWFDYHYRKHRNRMIATARELLDDHSPLDHLAEDIVQSVFVAMLAKYDRLKSHPNIGGWLTEALKLEIKFESQRAYHRYESAIPEGFDPLAEDVTLDDFNSILPADLSDEAREILYLHIYAGFKLTEIAKKLSISEEACRMRFLRAKRKCEKFYKKEENSSNGALRLSAINSYISRRCKDD